MLTAGSTLSVGTFALVNLTWTLWFMDIFTLHNNWKGLHFCNILWFGVHMTFNHSVCGRYILVDLHIYFTRLTFEKKKKRGNLVAQIS